MINTLAANAKQVGLELISLSDVLASEMQTWADALGPDNPTTAMRAGFITKPSAASPYELVVDVQEEPNEKPLLRVWAIETKVDDHNNESFNNIQLTFEADGQRVRDLIANSKTITRNDIRTLLQEQPTQLARITVSRESGGDGTKQTHGKRYDFTTAELQQHEHEIPQVDQTLQEVLQILKQSVTNSQK